LAFVVGVTRVQSSSIYIIEVDLPMIKKNYY